MLVRDHGRCEIAQELPGVFALFQAERVVLVVHFEQVELVALTAEGRELAQDRPVPLLHLQVPVRIVQHQQVLFAPRYLLEEKLLDAEDFIYFPDRLVEAVDALLVAELRAPESELKVVDHLNAQTPVYAPDVLARASLVNQVGQTVLSGGKMCANAP